MPAVMHEHRRHVFGDQPQLGLVGPAFPQLLLQHAGQAADARQLVLEGARNDAREDRRDGQYQSQRDPGDEGPRQRRRLQQAGFDGQRDAERADGGQSGNRHRMPRPSQPAGQADHDDQGIDRRRLHRAVQRARRQGAGAKAVHQNDSGRPRAHPAQQGKRSQAGEQDDRRRRQIDRPAAGRPGRRHEIDQACRADDEAGYPDEALLERLALVRGRRAEIRFHSGLPYAVGDAVAVEMHDSEHSSRKS